MQRLALTQAPRLFFALVLFIGLALLGLQWARHLPSTSRPDADTAAAQANLSRLSIELAAQQQQTLIQINDRLRVLAGLPLSTAFEARACNRLLASQLDTLPGVDNLVVLNQQGQVRCAVQAFENTIPRDLLNAAMSGQRALLPIMHSNKVLFAVPLRDQSGRIEGNVLASAPLAGWLRMSQLARSDAITLTLLDSAGHVLVTEENSLDLLQGLPARREAGFSTGIDRNGKAYWQATALLGEAARGLKLVARQTVPDDSSKTASALLGLLGLTLFALAAFATIRLARSPLAHWWRRTKVRHSALLPSTLARRLRTLLAKRHGESTVILLRRNNEDLKRALAEQESRNTQLQRLDQLNQMLLGCVSLREAANAVAECARDLLPHGGGALLLRTRPGVVEAATSWGRAPQHEFSRPEDCWAQRLGQTYTVSQPQSMACCGHLKSSAPRPYVCVPLTAQGKLLGTLHLQAQANSTQPPSSWLAESLAKRAAGAISRIQRESSLRAQATRDPLTGLHNRRFLEETLALEEMRAKRRGTSIGLMILDVDYFKRFNDTFGHDAGDALLRALGRVIRVQVRKGDIPCRYGGEEFVIVLPGADLEITYARAEALRLAVREMQITHGEQTLGPITVSIGVACYPRHGANCQAVLKVADQALYAGKNAGRNRVMRPTPRLLKSV